MAATMHDDRLPMDPLVLLAAFRHALGRQTYTARVVADTLIEYRDRLDDDWRRQIIQDTENAIARDEAGDYNDVTRWRKVQEAMR